MGDVNGDNFVNIFDLVQVALQFGQIGGNLVGDVNQDSFVNVLDLVQVTRNFGQALSAPANLISLLRKRRISNWLSWNWKKYLVDQRPKNWY